MATINDLVLVHIENKPAFFARINDINADVKRGWYQVELLVLGLPLQSIVWILEEGHLQGEEFTMGGAPVRLELISPKIKLSPPPAPESDSKGKIIPLKRKP
ncbi:hypothetical protein [Desulfobacca acetoxidans]|uniref:Uncharacterized protein n=1 Tax=Desulfobacca acetoxidans (strain ATCC 700848 / DSM 11109 / ASRB2) TaxID=880072 RepID=F2NET3_DESAR|nr:hypothetical protein [Desulfobacca acetoxidans]AEB08273.1 hypothetical protein Desac_0383 [Desulfobacca acetoxidans DSM 11109]HAY23201.1 hypothetical protein [Desulfobacterales bacterium]